jgi:hypothetical protein
MPYGGGGGYGYSRPAGSSDWAIKSQQMAFGQREQANQYELAQGQAIGGSIAGAPKAFLEAQDMVQQMNIRAQTARANLMQEELRRRRLQQDIDMTDRLYQSDAMQLDVESRREQVRAMKLQNDLAMDKYNEEKQARAKGQELSLMEILSRAPAESRLETGETVIGGMAVRADGTSRVLTAEEQKQYSQRMQGLSSRGTTDFMERVRLALPNDGEIQAKFSNLLIKGASQEEVYRELSPMLEVYKPKPVAEKPESVKFAQSAADQVKKLIANQQEKDYLGNLTSIGDPARIDALKQIEQNILSAKVTAEMNLDNKQAVEEVKQLVKANLDIASSQENIDGFVFFNAVSANAGLRKQFGFDGLKMSGEEGDALFYDISTGMGRLLSPSIDKMAQDLESQVDASGKKITASQAYEQARIKVYQQEAARLATPGLHKPSFIARAMRDQGYGNDAIGKFIKANFDDLDETEMNYILEGAR